MRTLGEAHRKDIIRIIQDCPVRFVFGGTEYVGTSGEFKRGRSLETGGFMPEPELTILVNLNTQEGEPLFGQDRPKVGDTITSGGVSYRLDSFEVDPFGESIQMDLRSRSK